MILIPTSQTTISNFWHPLSLTSQMAHRFSFLSSFIMRGNTLEMVKALVPCCQNTVMLGGWQLAILDRKSSPFNITYVDKCGKQIYIVESKPGQHSLPPSPSLPSRPCTPPTSGQPYPPCPSHVVLGKRT